MTSIRTLFTVREVADLIDGELYFPSHGLAEGSDRDAPICSANIDSRKCGAGSMFVPLSGRFADGHDFIEDAVSRGATFVLVSTEFMRNSGYHVRQLADRLSFAYFVVPDVLECFQNLARYYLGKFSSITKIGITGSNGKTTTKEMLGAILRLHSPTCVSQGNYNSEIGLPLSIFELSAEHRYGVFEMAMNHRGEMELLSDILRPDIGLITNIGRAHIGLLGSQDRIAEEKKKIFSRYSGKERAFLPEHDAYLEFLSRGINGRVHLYGRFSTSGVTGVTDRGIDGSTLHWHGFDIHIPLPGEHNVLNALGAISVALELGVPEEVIQHGLQGLTPQFGRSEVIRGPVTLIQDCYNANPDSVSQSISAIERMEWRGRKILVLGAMMELGEQSETLHREVGRDAAKARPHAIFLVGPEMEVAAGAVKDAGFGGDLFFAKTTDELADALRTYVQTGDLVLLKGSRSLGLETLTPVIRGERSSNRG